MPDLVSAFVEAAARDLARPFVHHLQGGARLTLTYGDLLRRAWRARSRLEAAGVRRGDVVLLVLRHCPEQYAWFLAAMMLGAAPAFMPFKTPKQDAARYWSSHRALFDRIEARLLVTWAANADEVRASLPGAAPPLLTVEDGAEPPPVAEALAGARALRFEPGEVAFLQHSSGTTGLKKGVLLSHGAVLRQVAAYRAALGLGPDHVIASWLPLYHDMGLLACYVGPLVSGNTVVALDPFEWVGRPTSLLAEIERHRAHYAWLPNFAFLHLARYAREDERWDLSSMRAFVSCSEPCKPLAFERFLERFGPMGVRPEMLQVCYAMAEAVFAVTQTDPGARAQELRVDADALQSRGEIVAAARGPGMLSCGRPVPGASVRIVDAGGRPLPEDRVGEIAISADFLFDGYHKLPEVTAERLHAGTYRSGDMGFLHGGELYVVGRKDDLLIVYGQNFYAHEIEACVNAVPGAIPGRCVALGRFNEVRGSQDAVVIVEHEPGTDPALLQREVKRVVQAEMGLALAEVAPVGRGWLVKTTSGKISRAENLAKLLAPKEAAHA